MCFRSYQRIPPNDLFSTMFLLFVREKIINSEVLEVIQKQLFDKGELQPRVIFRGWNLEDCFTPCGRGLSGHVYEASANLVSTIGINAY